MPKQGKTPKKKSKEKTPQWRLEAFAKNFAELRQFGQCSDVVLNKIGSTDIVKYETLKNINKIVGHKGRNTGNFQFLSHPRATNRYTYFQPRDARDYVPLDVYGIGAENFGFITMGLLSRDTPDPLPQSI